jgi:integrase
MPFGATEETIVTAARHYLTLRQRAAELAKEMPDGLLPGAPRSVAQKRTGLRPLTAEDVQTLIDRLGTDSERRHLAEYQQAQQAFNDRLERTRPLRLLLDQAHIPYDQAYLRIKRQKRPDLWKPEQILEVMSVLRRLDI